jgi:hypothetical protein
VSKSSTIKVSSAHFQLQQATPTPSDRDIAELERQLFATIEPVATGSEPPRVKLGRSSPIQPVKSTQGRKSISANPLRSKSGTPKLGKKRPPQRKRFSRK